MSSLSYDKTMSELWVLAYSDDPLLAEVGKMAIKTINKLADDNRKLEQRIISYEMKYESTGSIFNRRHQINKIERYEKALKDIANSNEDTSCNEIAIKYEVIAEKALND